MNKLKNLLGEKVTAFIIACIIAACLFVVGKIFPSGTHSDEPDDSGKTYVVVAGYKNDFGFSFMDFVKRYNEEVTVKNFGRSYETYGINSKNINETVHKNGIVEVECKLRTDGLGGYIGITVYSDGNSNKIKEISIYAPMKNDRVRADYASIVDLAIDTVNNAKIGVNVLKELDFYRNTYLNKSGVKKVAKGKFEYVLLTSSSSLSDGPIIIFSIKPKE